MEYTMLCAMYFGRAFQHFISLKDFGGFGAVGIDPYSSDWDEMVRKVAHFEKCFDGDGGTFDATWNFKQFLVLSIEIMIEWTVRDLPNKDQHAKTMMALALSGLELVHKAGDFCYGTSNGIASGFFLTTTLNSFSMFLHLVKNFRDNVPPQLATVTKFKEHVRVVIFGDDHTVTMSDEVCEYFNFNSMQKQAKELNLRYTPGTKGEENRPYWPLSETSFLKNKIGRMGPYYVALLDKTVMHEMINWIRKSEDPDDAVQVNIRTAQRFYFFYGKEEFDAFTAKILSVAPHSSVFTYRQLETIYNRYGAWEPEHFNPYKMQVQ
jgi:hypothetical protein